MNLQHRIDIGQQALGHRVAPGRIVAVLTLLWATGVLALNAVWHPPFWIPACLLVHVACAWRLLPQGRFWEIGTLLIAPATCLYLLPRAIRTGSLSVARAGVVPIPAEKDHVDLPDLRLSASGTTLDLDSRQLVGSMHDRMQDMDARTELISSAIQDLQGRYPGAILVSGPKRHALVSHDGQVLAVRGIFA